MRYTIHPQLEINILPTQRRYRKYFENEYLRVSRFKPSEDRTVINVHIVKQLPKHQKGDRRRSLSFKKIFKYEYTVRNLETSTVDIFFQDSAAGKLYAKNITLFLQAQVLEPVVYYKLLQKNVLFMHAAGVSDGKHGYLFPAYGGTGKTTLTLGLMGEGMEVLGDDLLLVEPSTSKVYPYLRPLHIFTYNVKTLRDATIPLLIRAKVKTKDILRIILENLTKQEFLISTRVHADTLYATFRAGKVVSYRKVLFLKKTGEDEKIKITKKNIKELARKILKSEDLNESLYKNILDASEKTTTQELELAVIEGVLSKVEYLEFINTRLLDFRDLKSFKLRILA